MKLLSDIEYEEIQRRLAWLDCLIEAGVDGWEGVDLAHMLYAERMGD
jgi:hypothetical protein